MAGSLSKTRIDDFFRIAVHAIQAEDLQLRVLLQDRFGYGNYPPGIQTAFETGAVYAIFKSLLASPFSAKYTILWEGAHGEGHQLIDLIYTRHHAGLYLRVGVEVKWWGKGPAPIAQDCRKLGRARDLTHGYVLVLHVWKPSGRSFSLERLIERSLRGPHFGDLNAQQTHYRELDVLTYFGEPAKLGLAMLATW